MLDWDNMENARKYMESDNLRKYLQTAGAEIVNITYLDEQEIQFKVISRNILKNNYDIYGVIL